MIEGSGLGGENCMNSPAVTCYPALSPFRLSAAFFSESSFETRINWAKNANIPTTLPTIKKMGVVSCQRSMSHPIPT